jgi:hypothetical protein
VGSLILRAHVRFGLDDPTDSLAHAVIMDEVQAYEFTRHEECVLARIEGAGDFLGHVA